MSYEVKQKQKLDELESSHYDGPSYLSDLYVSKAPTNSYSENVPLIGEVSSYGSQDNEDDNGVSKWKRGREGGRKEEHSSL